MSLTPHDLALIQEAGTPDDRKYAKRIYPIRKRGNFLLCTILLGNVLVNSTTTILLDTLISGILAVAGATFAIVIFGEIIPQAVCSRHGLKIGSKTIILTRIFMIITSPVAFPLSKILDCILGEEVGSTYTRDQMSALLKHTQTTDIEDQQYHMGVVVEHDNSSEKDPKARAVGIVTLEDIIEEMIQEEIIDETDVFTDNRGKVRNMLSQAPNFSAFIRQTETSDDTTKISAQMKVAILQFLSTCT
ncbi:unnamed protein product [Rotaria sp. Silwood1]|nr:unnamed protein product [Rotaria sp. Silwood1]CAF4910335.1 unnamed protein product [Rotaria sp. Silwood1]